MTPEARREVCDQLQALQRNKLQFRKSRIMVENRTRAVVAGSLGYESRMDEKKRAALFTEARKVIKRAVDGEDVGPLTTFILRSQMAIEAFDEPEAELEKAMVKLAKTLPVAAWVAEDEQRGFGLSSLATVIGEAGDLSLYSNPAKLWKRMGCAPFTKGDKTFMGATWKSGTQGKLSAEEWEAFGYSPRRRSIAYVIGECLIKANKSIYRERYDASKESVAAAHPDYKPQRCHRHGMLLATKLVLKNLWIQWEPEARTAVPDWTKRAA